MTDEWICPACGRPVADDEPYVSARAYSLAPDFATESEKRIDLGPARFHANDFTDRIETTYYELFPGEDA